MNSNLRRRLKAIANDLRGPLGRIPFDRVLRRHLDLFEELRRGGCTWLQLVVAGQATFRPLISLLCTILGVGELAAKTILAEIGIDMGRFPTAGHLLAWAGLCPG
jgi:transposase